MCLAVPLRIEKIDGQRATAVLEEARVDVSLALVPQAKVGDWILVHAGFAITLLDPQEAKATYNLLEEIAGR